MRFYILFCISSLSFGPLVYANRAKVDFEKFIDHKYYLLPGETFTSQVVLKNQDDVVANNVSFVVNSESLKLSLIENQVSIDNIEPNEAAISGGSIQFAIADNVFCGSRIPVRYRVYVEDQVVDFVDKQLQIGKPIYLPDHVVKPDIEIPINDVDIESTISFENTSLLVSKLFQVEVLLENIGENDLTSVKLISPNGEVEYLEKTKDFAPLPIIMYELKNSERNIFRGEALEGEWVLNVFNSYMSGLKSKAKLKSWKIKEVERFDCSGN